MNKTEAIRIQKQAYYDLGVQEIAIVQNPEYVYSPVELYPLAPKKNEPLSKLVACVMDMDGTTTSTEPLCIHSQEFMIRKITGMLGKCQWSGFDEVEDYPNIIGNSTTRHVEYLIRKFNDKIVLEHLMIAYMESVIWTFFSGQRFGRWNEVKQNLSAVGLGDMLNDLKQITPDKSLDSGNLARQLYYKYQTGNQAGNQAGNKARNKAGSKYQAGNQDRSIYQAGCCELEFNTVVRIAIDIYYARYHLILSKLLENVPVEDEYLINPAKSLIEPMTGVAFYLALLKGWIDSDELEALYDSVLLELAAKAGVTLADDPAIHKQKLKLLAGYFINNPLKLALVTSSIASEAEIVLTEVMKAIQKEIDSWPLGGVKKNRLKEGFADYQNIYDAVITANDSSEIRLKPHRDLYSIALYQLAVKKEDYQYVIGCEDSESGIIAMRAAGIGCSIALPFRNTENHKFWAASHVLPGVLPELILKHYCHLDMDSFMTPD